MLIAMIKEKRTNNYNVFSMCFFFKFICVAYNLGLIFFQLIKAQQKQAALPLHCQRLIWTRKYFPHGCITKIPGDKA